MRKTMVAAFAALATLVAVSPANAATYTVDSSASSLSLSNLNAAGFQFGGQGANSANLIAFYAGTVEATVTGGGANPTISFGGGSNIDALLNPNASGGEYLPTEGGYVPPASNDPNKAGGDYVFADGSPDPTGEGDNLFSVGEDNYGVEGTGFAQAIKSSVRNFAVDFTGGGTANDAVADTQDMTVINGWYAIDLAGAGVAFNAEEQTEVWAGQALGVTESGDLGHSLVGTLETITIPYQKSFVAFGVLNATISGTIVATRTVPVIVPEPTSGLFLATLVTGAGAFVRRRRK